MMARSSSVASTSSTTRQTTSSCRARPGHVAHAGSPTSAVQQGVAPASSGPVVTHQGSQRLGWRSPESWATRRRLPPRHRRREAGRPDRQRDPRSAGLRFLLDELDLHGRGGVLHQRLGDPIGLMADHHPGAGDIDLRHGVEDVKDHRAATETVQPSFGRSEHTEFPHPQPEPQQTVGTRASEPFFPPGPGHVGIHQDRYCFWAWGGALSSGCFRMRPSTGCAYPTSAVRRVEVAVSPGRQVSSLMQAATEPVLACRGLEHLDFIAGAQPAPAVVHRPSGARALKAAVPMVLVDDQQADSAVVPNWPPTQWAWWGCRWAGSRLARDQPPSAPQAGPLPRPGRRDARGQARRSRLPSPRSSTARPASPTSTRLLARTIEHNPARTESSAP